MKKAPAKKKARNSGQFVERPPRPDSIIGRYGPEHKGATVAVPCMCHIKMQKNGQTRIEVRPNDGTDTILLVRDISKDQLRRKTISLS